MRAMQLPRLARLADNPQPLVAVDLPMPLPAAGEVVVQVVACGVCHTELDEIEGRTPPPQLPIVPGHQIVGRIAACGDAVSDASVGDRVGIAWIWSACGSCDACCRGQENLCPAFIATGRDRDGGYAEYAKAPAAFTHPLPDELAWDQAAPLLCAGAIGYRSLALTGLENGQILALTGFGASGHLVLQLARHRLPDSPVFVFARRESEQSFARELGAAWAGPTDASPPEPVDAAIDTTPAWHPVLAALRILRPGGRLVINAIRKESADRAELATLDYERQLWLEKEIKSVANVTRNDVRQTLALAAQIPLRPAVRSFPLADANRALAALAHGGAHGATILSLA